MSHLVSIFKLLLVLIPIAIAFYYLLKKRDEKRDAVLGPIAGNINLLAVWLKHCFERSRVYEQQLAIVADQTAEELNRLRRADESHEAKFETVDKRLPPSSKKASGKKSRPAVIPLGTGEEFAFDGFPSLPIPPAPAMPPLAPMTVAAAPAPPTSVPATAQTAQPSVIKRRMLVIGAVVLIACLIGATAYMLNRMLSAKPTESLEAKAAKAAQVQPTVTPLANECSACKPVITGGIVDTEGDEPNLKYVWANSCGDTGNCSSCKPAAVCTNSSPSVISPGCATASCIKR